MTRRPSDQGPIAPAHMRWHRRPNVSTAAGGGAERVRRRRTIPARVHHRACVLVAALAFGACTVGPDYKRPPSPMPAIFRGDPAPSQTSIGDLAWWRVFEDETLQELIRIALRENYDVRVAAARILDSRAQVTIARSFQFPEVNHRATAIYSRVEGERDIAQPKEDFQPAAGFELAFELDFWGRFRRSTEAARAELLATEEARRFVISTLVTDVATAYFQLRSLDGELEVALRTLGARQDSLRLVNQRSEGGVASLIDVRQAEILVAQAAEAVVDTQRLIEQTENTIAVLLGRNPDTVPRGRPLGQQIALPDVPPGVPSAMFERRPDIRQAEARLHAATARIGVAKAAFFPRVFLSGIAAGGGLMIDGRWVGPQGLFSIGPQITLPIFNTGRTQAGVHSAEARTEETLAQYRQTILQAFREVADALVEHRKRREFRTQQEALVTAAGDAARLADIRYKGGVTSYLEVLDSERQFFDAQLGLVRSNRDVLLAVVRLYRALGGGWQDEREARREP
jgi:multidrug efflux system outer membrane protein